MTRSNVITTRRAGVTVRGRDIAPWSCVAEEHVCPTAVYGTGIETCRSRQSVPHH